MTDACLVLGWLDPAWALADTVRLDLPAARRALERLCAPLGRDSSGVATGIVAVATALMARALKRVSVARGVDPRRLALVPFGGAGPLFGCALADLLGMRTVVIPPHPGVLSALGLSCAAERIEVMAAVHRSAGAARGPLRSAYAELEARANGLLPDAMLSRFADCRFAGQGYEITIPVGDSLDGLEAQFNAEHRARFGHAGGGGDVEIVNARVVAERAGGPPVLGRRVGIGRPTPGWRPIEVRGARLRAQVWPLGELPEGLRISGPAVLAGPDATALIEPGWRGIVHGSGVVVVERR